MDSKEYISKSVVSGQLDLSGLQLTNLPSLPSLLIFLDCSKNDISTLPDNLPYNLDNLNCSFNNLKKLPDKLPRLFLLNCSYNKITRLPDKLPSSLKVLYCTNKYIYIPKKYAVRFTIQKTMNYNKKMSIIKQNWIKNKIYRIITTMLDEQNYLSMSFSSCYGDRNLIRLISLFL